VSHAAGLSATGDPALDAVVPESRCMPKSERSGYASQFAVWRATHERHLP
jgi:hypothetical protein